MTNKVCFITGANSGVGKATAWALAKQGFALGLVCRNAQKGKQTEKELIQDYPDLRVQSFEADLSSQAQVRRLSQEILARHAHIDVLINNAGFMGYPERRLTEDGIESTLAVNHLAPFLLTNLLLPALKAAPQGRIINVSSVTHKYVKMDWDNFQAEKNYQPLKVYAHTKLMNILFTRELAERTADSSLTVNALHPGTVATGIAKTYSSTFQWMYWLGRPFMLSARQGAETSIYLASSPEVAQISGQYFVKCKAQPVSSEAKNSAHQKKLWEVSSHLCGLETSLADQKK